MRIVCWDVNYDDDDDLQQAPAGVQRMTTEPAGTFDVLLALDVIEHAGRR